MRHEDQGKRRPVALVTGGAIRVGRSIALALAREGYDVAIHYNSSSDGAQKTLEELKITGGSHASFPLDLSETGKINEFVRNVKDKMGGLDVLVNSASVYDKANLRDTDPELFEKQFRINLEAPFFLTSAFARHAGRGHILNIIDNKIAFQQFSYAAYLLSKKGLAEFTKLAALELAPEIRVNGVAPGVTLPPPDRSEEYLNWRIQGIPLQKSGDPEFIAEAVLFFLRSEFITGQILMVDGGESVACAGQNLGNFHPGEEN